MSARARSCAPTRDLGNSGRNRESLLVDLASILLTGHDAPVVSIDTSREEAEKRLGASLLAGDALVSFRQLQRAGWRHADLSGVVATMG